MALDKKQGVILVKTIETVQIDLQYEKYRLRDKNRENILLSSISECGVREPVVGVLQADSRFILLDGFKRYRCCQKLNIQFLPYTSIGEDAASGIIQLIKISNAKSLHLIEQAKLVDDLKDTYRMNVVEIAEKLERSSAWVSVRLGLLKEMSDEIREKVFSGDFPARSYMYTLRHFTRVKKVSQKDAIEFVRSVSGKNLSTRSVEILARGFFNGGNGTREQIKKGNFRDTLDRLKHLGNDNTEEAVKLNEQEKGLINDLEIAQKYERKIIQRHSDERLKDMAFFAEAGILADGIIRQSDDYQKAIRKLYDKCRQV